MPTWIKARVDADSNVIAHIAKRFYVYQHQRKINKDVYLDLHNDTSLTIKTRSSYGLYYFYTELDLIEEASKNFPMAVVLLNEKDEGRYDEPFEGYSSIMINGEKIPSKDYAKEDQVKGYTFSRHTHEYDKSGNPTKECLSQHYGYIYSITNKELDVEYVGQHKTKLGESWPDYFGSSMELKQIMKEKKREGFEKRLIAFADDEADLTIQEIKAISNLMHFQPAQCKNNTIGGCDTTRAIIYDKTFESIEDYENSSKDLIVKRVANFLNSLSPYEYDLLRHEIKEFVDPSWHIPSEEMRSQMGLDESGLLYLEDEGRVMVYEIKTKTPDRAEDKRRDEYKSNDPFKKAFD